MSAIVEVRDAVNGRGDHVYVVEQDGIEGTIFAIGGQWQTVTRCRCPYGLHAGPVGSFREGVNHVLTVCETMRTYRYR